jgi:hypothetical protein
MGAAFGVGSTGLLAASLMVVPVALLFTMHEPRPGVYRARPGESTA